MTKLSKRRVCKKYSAALAKTLRFSTRSDGISFGILLVTVTLCMMMSFNIQAVAQNIYDGSQETVTGEHINYDGLLIKRYSGDAKTYTLGDKDTKTITLGTGGAVLDTANSYPNTTVIFNASESITSGGIFNTSSFSSGVATQQNFFINTKKFDLTSSGWAGVSATDGKVVLRGPNAQDLMDSVSITGKMGVSVDGSSPLFDALSKTISITATNGNGLDVTGEGSAVLSTGEAASTEANISLVATPGAYSDAATVRVAGDKAKDISIRTKGDVLIENTHYNASSNYQKAVVLQAKGSSSINIQGGNVTINGTVNNEASSASEREIKIAAENDLEITSSIAESAAGSNGLEPATVFFTGDASNQKIDLSGRTVSIANTDTNGRAISLGTNKSGSSLQLDIEAAEGFNVSGYKGLVVSGNNNKANLILGGQSKISATGENAAGIIWVRGGNHIINIDNRGGSLDFDVSGKNAAGIFHSYNSMANMTLSNGDKLTFNLKGDKASAIKGTGGWGGPSYIKVKNYKNVEFLGEKNESQYGIYSAGTDITINANNKIIFALDKGTAIYQGSATSGGNVVSKGVLDLAAPNIGIAVNSGTGIEASDKAELTINASDTLSIQGSSAVVGKTGSQTTLTAKTVNISATGANGSALSASGSGTQIDLTADSGTVNGDLSSVFSGTIDMALNKDGSWTGKSSSALGTANITLGGTSRWNVTGTSTLASLALNGGTLNIAHPNTAGTIRAGSTPLYKSVTTSTLTGTDGNLVMGINLGTEDASKIDTDQLKVTGKAEGTLTADITITGRDVNPDKKYSNNWMVSQGADSALTITNKAGTNSFTGNGMVTTWALGFPKAGNKSQTQI